MSELGRVVAVLGGVILALSLPVLVIHELAKRALRAFPRNVIAGYALTFVDLVWAAWLLYHAVFIADIHWARPAVLILTPLLYVMIVMFMNEILASRALGGLLMIIPSVILEAARASDEPLRLIPVVVAYLLAIVGIVLMLSPFKFRKAVEKLSEDDFVFRLCGAFGTCLGVALISLAVAAL